MFCVLNVEKRELTLLEKIFRFLQKDEYLIKVVPVFRGAPFYVIDASVCTDKIDWDAVVECAGKCSKRMLISDSIDIPKRNDIDVFKSNLLYKKAFQNTVLKILDINGYSVNPQSVAVLDKQGSNADLILQITKYASNLTVVTENKSKFEKVCDSILENTGICVSLRSDFDDATIKIDTERNIMSISFEKEFVNIMNGENLRVSDVYKRLIPQGINEYDFFSALYELCGVFSLKECVFETVEVNNEKKRVDDCYFS